MAKELAIDFEKTLLYVCGCVVVWLCLHMPNAPPSWRGWFMLHANPRGKLRVMAASNLRPLVSMYQMCLSI